ncbi:type II CAAX prenyl endopeptidase Rce1 family protein [Rubrivirga sp. IMCC45206]|uniref:CPBP family glutamic-type intramembrane protease n=1 Tax=Rubrivirga sp. IMCC45206 TaxID=3391614 RepID=UPI00398F9416
MIDPTTETSTPPVLESPPASPPPSEVLVDAWDDAEPMPLTGWFERNGFSPILTALFVFVLAFLLFQLVIAPIVLGIGVIWDAVQNGDGTAPDMGQIMEQLTTNGRLMLTANTVGQALGFGLLAVVVARLHTPAVRAFLRIRRPDGPGLGLAALGWATLYPAVLWTGQLNSLLPLPDWLRELEATQVDFLEGLLMGGDLSTPFLFVALALTPAICEELLFRGYLQRQVERRWGTVASIVLVGVLFGLYHLRLTQAVPLALLGVYLGFVVWATGSLWAGFLVHLLNNGLAVAATAFARADPDLDLESLEAMGVPWYLGIVGLVLTAFVVRAMIGRRESVVGTRSDALPVPLSPTLPSQPFPSP